MPRFDVYLENDAGGFSILSAGAVPRALAEAPDGAALVESGQAILVSLVGDDSFIARVVVGGELTEAESQEWIARVRRPLEIRGGRILFCAGFDPRCLEQWQEEDARESVRGVKVPDGRYVADVYTYLHTMNGRVFLESAWNESLGAWFRRDHKKRAFPSWVAAELARSPEDDPGHEKKWEKLAASVEKGKLAIEREPLDWVGFLVHLRPFDPGAELTPVRPDGWIEHDAGLRKPKRCPLGVPAVDAHDPEVRSELKDILPRPPRPPVETVDVAARIADRPPVALRGGPVEHPVEKLVQVYRLAWLATDGADPELRFPAAFTPDVAGIDHVAATAGRIGFGASGAKWAQIRAVEKLGPRLKALPDGSVLDLMTAPEPDAEQHRDYGVHRYRGEVRGGVWRIAETYPALDAVFLREALAFSAAVDGGKSVPLGDRAVGPKAMELSKEDDVLFSDNPLVLRKDSLGLTKKDVGLLHFVAGYVFRARWSDTWPCWTESEEDQREFREAMAKLSRAAERIAKKAAEAEAPKGPRETVLQGKTGTFEKIELVTERPKYRKTIEIADRQMKAIGFHPLGDLVWSRAPEVMLRGYARASGDVWAAFVSGAFQSSIDFVTQWESAGLTTTLTKQGPGDQPLKGLYVTRLPNLGLTRLGELLRKHEERKSALAKKLGETLRTEPTLAEFAAAVDRGLSRQMG